MTLVAWPPLPFLRWRRRFVEHGSARAVCAQLCISGGVPALFVTRDERGVETAYQLATREGHSIDQALLPYVAEPVLVRGELFQSGDQWVLHTDLDHVTRL